MPTASGGLLITEKNHLVKRIVDIAMCTKGRIAESYEKELTEFLKGEGCTRGAYNEYHGRVHLNLRDEVVNALCVKHGIPKDCVSNSNSWEEKVDRVYLKMSMNPDGTLDPDINKAKKFMKECDKLKASLREKGDEICARMQHLRDKKRGYEEFIDDTAQDLIDRIKLGGINHADAMKIIEDFKKIDITW